MKAVKGCFGIAAVMLVACVVAARSSAAPATAANEKPEVIFNDPTGSTTAAITQVFPNSGKEGMTLQNVKRISVCQEILIIEWGGTATTLLPRQFISSINLNKRAAATQP